MNRYGDVKPDLNRLCAIRVDMLGKDCPANAILVETKWHTIEWLIFGMISYAPTPDDEWEYIEGGTK